MIGWADFREIGDTSPPVVSEPEQFERSRPSVSTTPGRRERRPCEVHQAGLLAASGNFKSRGGTRAADRFLGRSSSVAAARLPPDGGAGKSRTAD